MTIEDRIALAERRLQARSQVQLSAHHEAGHAVIGWMMGQSVRHPGFVIDREGNGHAHVRGQIVMPRSSTPRGFLRMFDAANKMSIAVKVAGYAAEWRFAGCTPPRRYRPWTSTDYLRAFEYAATYFEVDADSLVAHRAVARAELHCNRLLARPEVWGAVTALAERLEASGQVSEDDADELLSEHLGEGWLPSGELVGR